MLKNAYFLAKIGADTAENEQHFAEMLPIGRRVADRRGGCPGLPPEKVFLFGRSASPDALFDSKTEAYE